MTLRTSLLTLCTLALSATTMTASADAGREDSGPTRAKSRPSAVAEADRVDSGPKHARSRPASQGTSTIGAHHRAAEADRGSLGVRPAFGTAGKADGANRINSGPQMAKSRPSGWCGTEYSNDRPALGDKPVRIELDDEKEISEQEVAYLIADLSGDGLVNQGDLAFFFRSWGTAAADLNGDHRTDGVDLGILLEFMQSCWG
jgi:hypothetical protein